MSTMTLLPCPFCGGEPEIVRAQDEDGRFAAVGCPHCGAGSRQHYFVGDDAVPHVVSAWNRRAHLAQPAQTVDVGAINGVIVDLERARKSGDAFPDEFEGWAETLTRAISGENAGPVDEPDQALLVSMATCLNHGFGLLDAQRQQSMLHDMRKLWDEVMGRGYYRPENRQRYLAYLASPAPDKEGKV